MEDQIVNFETAKLAYEKGFDWPCDYTRGGELGVDFYRDYQDDKYTKGDIENAIDNGYPIYLAPTQSLLQTWLRDTLNIFVYVTPTSLGDNAVFIKDCYDNSILKSDNMYKGAYDCKYTYEEALESGLLAALKTFI